MNIAKGRGKVKMPLQGISSNNAVYASQLPDIAKIAALSDQEIGAKSLIDAERKTAKRSGFEKALLPTALVVMAGIAAVKKNPAKLSGKLNEAARVSGSIISGLLGAMVASIAAVAIASKASDKTKKKINEHSILTSVGLLTVALGGMSAGQYLARGASGLVKIGTENFNKYMSDKIDSGFLGRATETFKGKYAEKMAQLTEKNSLLVPAKDFISKHAELGVILGTLGTTLVLDGKRVNKKVEVLSDTQNKLIEARDGAQWLIADIWSGNVDVENDIDDSGINNGAA